MPFRTRAASVSRLLPLLLAGLGTAAAQTPSFVPGYAVVAADTLVGEVSIGSEAEASRGLQFRESETREVRRLGVHDAEAFGTDDGRVYRRHTFQTRAVPEADPATPNERLGFGRVVRDGTADLLAFEVVDRRPLYYADLGAGPVGLFVAEDEVVEGYDRRVRVRALYRQTLLTLFAGCRADDDVYQTLPYTEAAFAAEVDRYNACLDPTYEAVAAATARRPVLVQLEAGAGGLSGSFQRLRDVGGSTGYTDPSPNAVHLQAGVSITPPALRFLRFRAGVEYDHDLMRVFRALPSREARISALSLNLGGHVASTVGDLRLGVGGGLLAGTLLESTTAEVASSSELNGVFRFVRPRDEGTSSIGGQYAEVSLGHRAFPLDVRLRAQSTALGYGTFFMPFMGTKIYRVQSVVATGVVTF